MKYILLTIILFSILPVAVYSQIYPMDQSLLDEFTQLRKESAIVSSGMTSRLHSKKYLEETEENSDYSSEYMLMMINMIVGEQLRALNRIIAMEIYHVDSVQYNKYASEEFFAYIKYSLEIIPTLKTGLGNIVILEENKVLLYKRGEILKFINRYDAWLTKVKNLRQKKAQKVVR